MSLKNRQYSSTKQLLDFVNEISDSELCKIEFGPGYKRPIIKGDRQNSATYVNAHEYSFLLDDELIDVLKFDDYVSLKKFRDKSEKMPYDLIARNIDPDARKRVFSLVCHLVADDGITKKSIIKTFELDKIQSIPSFQLQWYDCLDFLTGSISVELIDKYNRPIILTEEGENVTLLFRDKPKEKHIECF